MKKLLSLALVLTMLFTIISVPSVSAATYNETIIAAADFTGLTVTNKSGTTHYLHGFTADGTDADVSKNTGKAGSLLNVNSGATVTSGNKKYTTVQTAEATTSTAAGITEGIGADVPILKFTQTAHTHILRLYFADGAIDAADTANGETIEYRFKVYLTDFYSSSPYVDTTTNEEVPGVKIENPETFSWKLGPLLKDGTRKGTSTAVATGKWVDVTVVNNTLTDVGGVSMDGYGSGKSAGNYTKTYPGTIYIAAPSIVRVTPVASSNVAVTKIGEGTVTGGGEVATGSEATLTATPDEGYTFAGWYSKSDGKTSTTLLESNATYSFTVSEDTNVVAVFEKEAVNSWVELVNIPFDNSVSPSSTNFWTKSNAWTAEGAAASAGNIDGTDAYTTYAALEEAGISAPEGSHGENLLVISDDNLSEEEKANACGVGTVVGRINQIPGYYTRYTAGEKYRISAWIYVVNTYKEKDTLPFNLLADINNGTKGTPAESCTVEVGKWEKVELEFRLDEGSALINGSAGLRFDFANIKYSDLIAENSKRDTPKVAYIDSVKIERFEGVEVSAEAENGVVYGTGTYAKGDSVTLNAGPDAGYKFVGYYNKDTNELIKAEPSYTFTVTDHTTVVARFAERDAAVYDRNVLYHYGSEAGDVGRHNNWCFYDRNNDGELTTDSEDQDATETYNREVSYKEAAADGIFVPNDDPTFGDTLYMQKNTEKRLHNGTAGRFRGWENGEYVNNSSITEPTEASGRYVEGKKYRFTWWVYPVSMQLENGETEQPSTTTIIIKHNDGKDTGVGKTFTVNVGEWNMIDWTFTANDLMALYAPGIRYNWGETDNEEGYATTVNWAYYDNIQVSEITEIYEYGAETGDVVYSTSSWAKFAGAQFTYDVTDEEGKVTTKTAYSSNNVPVAKIVTYADAKIPQASGEKSGDNLLLYDANDPSKDAGIAGGKTDEWFDEVFQLSNLTAGPQGRIIGLAGGKSGKAYNADYTIGSTYRVSVKVYPVEQYRTTDGATNIAEEAKFRFVGSLTSGTSKEGRQVEKNIPYGQWTELSYTFKATADDNAISPSFYIGDCTKNVYKNTYTTKFYLDDLKVELIHVDDISLTIAEDETNVTATAVVNDIKSANTIKAMVIIAAYDADGKLINVALSSANGEDVEVDAEVSATYTKNSAEAVDKYVAFLWDSLTNIRPYVKPVTLGE